VWSTAHGFSRGGGDFIIRFSAIDEDVAKDRVAARFASPKLPIPAIVEMGEAFGGFYAISQRVAGDHLDQASGGEMLALLPSLFAALDAVRGADVSGTNGYGTWGANGTAPHPTWREALLDVENDRPTDRINGWREPLAASATGAGPFEEALRTLKALADHVPEERHLIHSDLLHNNVLFAGKRITAVLDWGCAMYGDFLYDIAWFSFWSAWYRAWDGIDFAREAKRHFSSIGLAVPDFEERIRCYELHIGLSGQAYSASAGHWDDLEWTARRTLAAARRR
jgi:hygromycin-B 4-O-kinase